MARTTGSDGGRTQAAIRDAALSLIARHGYEAVSMRQLAAEVGVQAAALYRYFPTKEDLLYTLMQDHMNGLIAAWEGARPATVDPTARLAAYVENHIAFHIERRSSTHVSNMELRTILRDGAEKGVFAVDDIGLTAMALIQMMTGVIVWYRPGERLSIDGVTETYLSMTMRLVGAPQPAGEQRHVHAHA